MRHTGVGIRDAKIHLSRYLKLVQKGEEVIITDQRLKTAAELEGLG